MEFLRFYLKSMLAKFSLSGPPTTNVEEYQSNSFDSEKEVFEEADETPMPPRSPKKILFADETHRQPSVEVSGPEPSDDTQEVSEGEILQYGNFIIAQFP